MRELLVAFCMAFCVAGLASGAEVEAKGAASVVSVVNEGRRAVVAGKLEQARELAEQAVVVDPAYVEAWKLLGSVHVRMGNTNDALKAYTRALVLAPDDATANSERVRLLWSANPKEAMAYMESAIRSGGVFRDEFIRKVLTFMAEQGDGEGAVAKAQAWKPGFSIWQLGADLIQNGKPDAARVLLDAECNRMPEGDQAAWRAYADALQRKQESIAGRLSDWAAQATNGPGLSSPLLQAVWVSASCVRDDPQVAGLWSWLYATAPANVQARTDVATSLVMEADVRRVLDTATAAAMFESALWLQPDLQCWADVSLMRAKQTDAKQEGERLEASLAAMRSKALIDGVKGRLADLKGDVTTAVALYDKSLAATPDQPALRLMLIDVLLRSGQRERAASELNKASTLARTDWRQEELARLWLMLGSGVTGVTPNISLLMNTARVKAREGKWEEAVRYASLAASNNVTDARIWRELGMAESRCLRFNEAASALKKAVELAPDDAVAWQEYGWALWRQGKKEEGLAAWDKAFARQDLKRSSFPIQVLGRMAEEGETELALKTHAQWFPGESIDKLGVELAKLGRLVAATPFLESAWKRNPNHLETGIYLAKARSKNNNFAGAMECLRPTFKTGLSKATPEQIVIALDTLKLCAGVEGAVEVFEGAVAELRTNERYSGVGADVYISYGESEYGRKNYAAALAFFEKGLELDPNRLIWSWAWDIAVSLNEEDRAVAMARRVLEKTRSPAVKSGIQGRLAERDGELAVAKGHYLASLQAEQNQPEIQMSLFDVAFKLGDLEVARKVVEFIAYQSEAGKSYLRAPLATMYGQLGEEKKALELWEVLHLSAPENPRYANELALCLFRTGRGEDAVKVLGDSVAAYPNERSAQMLVEFLTALGRPADAVKFMNEHSALTSPKLRRYLAFGLEASGAAATTTLAAAEVCYTEDKESLAVAMLYARSLDAVGQTNEAAKVHESLLARNDCLIASQVYLRNYETTRREVDEAENYARMMVEQRPWDDNARRRYAMTLAERSKFYRAVGILLPLASQEIEDVVSVLFYNDITVFDYAGMNTIRQLEQHIGMLAKEGFRFGFVPGEFKGKDKKVIVIVANPDLAVVDRLDGILERNNARVLALFPPEVLRQGGAQKPSPGRMKELAATGRWEMGVLLPGMMNLTRREQRDGKPESDREYKDRINTELEQVAKNVGGARQFFYPAGDYGQLSLDTDWHTLDLLSDAMRRQVDYAYFLDDVGFVSDRFDAMRIPVKAVAADWDAAKLLDHLKAANSAVHVRLEVAKFFYWHGQSEAASHWFAKALEAGADPAEIAFNAAANARMGGDIRTACERGAEALMMAPTDERVVELMKKIQDDRRPTAGVDAATWWDTDDRTYYRLGAEAEGPITDAFRWMGAISRHKWERDGFGNETGSRYDMGLRAFVTPGVWVDGALQFWNMDEAEDEMGWRANLHLPSPYLRGNADLMYSREVMDTVEAVRDNTTADRLGLATYSRLLHFWDIYLNGSLVDVSDGNDQWFVDGRIMRRFSEDPYIAVGYAGRAADSTIDLDQYWTPQNLEQHQLYVGFRNAWDRWNVPLSAQAGYSQEEGTDWRFVIGCRGGVRYRMTTRLSLGAEGAYQQSAVYERATINGFLEGRW